MKMKKFSLIMIMLLLTIGVAFASITAQDNMNLRNFYSIYDVLSMNLVGNITSPKYCIGTDCITSWSYENSSWNESYANTLYAPISEPIASSLGNWSADKSSYNTTSQLNTLYLNRSSEGLYTTTYNSTYDAKVTDNSSWNQSYANTLYLNRSSEGLYTTTYNSTYDAKVTDNSSWNEIHANTLYMPINATTGNVSWNQSYANTLYAPISEPIASSLGNWSADKSGYYQNTGGTINGNVNINGNLTIIGAYINATVTNQYLNGSFLPSLNSTFNLGSTNQYWNNLYANNMYNKTTIDFMLLSYAPISEPIASGLGNWSADKSSYNTTSQLNTLYLNRSSEGLYTTTYNSTYDAKVTDNSSWNETHANTLYMPINTTTGNVSWNQSYANTLYASISEPIASSLGNWSADKSSYNTTAQLNTLYLNRSSEGLYTTTYNSTYDVKVTDNSSWNESYTNTLYVPYTGANSNIDLGDKNITTTGFGKFSWIDKLAQDVEPGVPPEYTLRLWVDYDAVSGFSTYRYRDNTSTSSMTRRIADNVFIGKNMGGVTIPVKSVVYSCGSSGLGAYPLLCLAKADNISTMPSIGITIEDITSSSFGRVMSVGVLENVNTDSFLSNQPLYVSDTQAGNLTVTKPLIPNLTQEIGTVLVKSATKGKIELIARSLTGNEFGTINNFVIVGNLTAPNICYSNGTNCATGGNSSWNQSLADTLYLGIADQRYNESGIISANNASWLSTYNSSYAALVTDNSSWNESYARTLFALITEPIAASLGNWSADRTNYYNNTALSNSSIAIFINSTMGNWSADKSSYQTTSAASTMNSSMKTYVDTTNSSMKTYVDTTNSSMKTYVDTTNSSMKTYVDTELSNNNASWLSTYNVSYDVKVTDNQSWNESYANTLYLNRSSEGLYTTTYNSTYDAKVSDNSSWNETYANTLYAPISEPIASSLGNWSADKSSYNTTAQLNTIYLNRSSEGLYTTTYNSTYDAKVTDNSSWNETYANTLYALITEPIASGLGNWSADKVNYNTTSELNNLYMPINATTGNISWNESYANTLYALITEPIAASLGNWSADRVNYYNNTALSNSSIAVYINSSLGNWSADKSSYQTTSAASTMNSSMKTYVDTTNSSMKTYVDTTNTSMTIFTGTNYYNNTALSNSSLAVYINSTLGNWTKDKSSYLLANGSIALTGNWNVGAYNITANTFNGYVPASNVTAGTFGTGSYTMNTNFTLSTTDNVSGLVFGANKAQIYWNGTALVIKVS